MKPTCHPCSQPPMEEVRVGGGRKVCQRSHALAYSDCLSISPVRYQSELESYIASIDIRCSPLSFGIVRQAAVLVVLFQKEGDTQLSVLLTTRAKTLRSVLAKGADSERQLKEQTTSLSDCFTRRKGRPGRSASYPHGCKSPCR